MNRFEYVYFCVVEVCLQGKFTRVGLLGSKVSVYVLLLVITKFPSRKVVCVCIPTSTRRVPGSHSLASECAVILFYYPQADG